ncbi:MAG: hypothetical protein JSU00_11695 [Acidobacteria bacterium]|nr:hypothetical protein [Acidobacteriota bacterium]
MTASEIARVLSAKRSGDGWMACCPAHEDRTPSLHISEGIDGKVLVKCFAGCGQRAVLDALRGIGLDCGDRRETSEWLEWRDGIRYRRDWGAPVCAYRYHDEHGVVLYSVVRFAPKDFKPGYYDGAKWTWKKHPNQVLYRLPEVLEAPIVFVVEGERDVETMRAWGFVATTNAGGANAPWLPQYTESLRGREVILIPDNDAPGLGRVVRIARELRGRVERLVFLRLDGAKDISEWFDHGHSEVELVCQLDGEAARR